MEINKYTDIVGVVATEAIVEGRMVVITNAGASHDFGSRTDLPGIKLPANSTDAAKAKFVSAFALDNRQTPLLTYPSNTYALRRGGWDQDAQTPFNTDVYVTHPGNMSTPQTIPSGELALALDRGVFTVTSGNFVYSADLTPGANLSVCNTEDDGADDSGKLQYDASGTIGTVEYFDSTNFTLTFRTL